MLAPSRRISPGAPAATSVTRINEWKHPQQRWRWMFRSLQSAACVPDPVGLAHSLGGHMAQRNYAPCTSLSGEYLSASVVLISADLKLPVVCLALHCVRGVRTWLCTSPVVNVQPDGDDLSCTAITEPHDVRVIRRPAWLGGRASWQRWRFVGFMNRWEVLGCCCVKWLQVLLLWCPCVVSPYTHLLTEVAETAVQLLY